MPLRLKVTLILVLASLIGDALFITLWQPWHFRQASERERQVLQSHLVTLGDAVTPFLLQNQIGAIHESLDATLEREPHWRALILRDHNQTVLYPLDAGLAPAGTDLVSIGHAIELRNQILGRLELTVDLSEQHHELKRQTWLIVGLITLGFLLAAVLIAVLLEFAIGRRTRQLVAAAEDIAHGNFASGLPDRSNDEIGRLAVAFDSMRQAIATEKEALRASAIRYRNLVDNLPQIIWQKDADSVYVASNTAYARSLGTTPEALAGKTDLDFYPTELAEKHRADDRRILTGGVIESLEESLLVEGQERYVHTTKIPLWGTDGRAYGTLGITEDITERKRAELELKQHREHLEELVAERTADLLENHRQLTQIQFALDRVGIGITWNDVETGSFVYVNDESCRQLGYTREELLQLTISDINPAYSPAAAREACLGVVESGLLAQVDTEHRRKDGSSYPVAVTFYAFRDGDRLLTIAFYQDISERKQAEDELLKAKEAAEAANVAKSAFLANMSHEIRTPLNGILGLARIAMRENSGSKAGEISKKILKSGQHLVGIIDDILDFSKLEAGKLVIVPVPLSIALLVEEAMGFVAELAAEKMVMLTTHLASDLPQWVIGDPLRIRQILANLLSNAVKFAEKGEVVLDVRRAGSEILFSVSDGGIGMSPEQLAKLFQPFQQADDSITRKFGGTGLGLAISMNLARVMGGGIDVTSQPGLGSTFTLRLALPETAARPASESRNIHGSGKRLEGLRVLVAEDIEINREVLDDMLTCEGATCLMVTNGQEAVSTIADDPSVFDVVLMDIQMPVMDGREAARQIQVIAPALPIIALTAHALQEERELSRMAGMVDHVSKPIDPDELVKVVLAHTGLTVMAEDAPVQPVPAVPPAPTLAAEAVLPDIPELDLVVGLRFLKDRTRYRRMLDKFVALHAQDAELIRAAMAAGKPDEAYRLAHSLKSLAATLGAVSLSETAYALEQQLKEVLANPAQQADVSSQLTALDAALAKLINGIRATTTT